jgi:hypothetical protein
MAIPARDVGSSRIWVALGGWPPRVERKAWRERRPLRYRSGFKSPNSRLSTSRAWSGVVKSPMH